MRAALYGFIIAFALCAPRFLALHYTASNYDDHMFLLTNPGPLVSFIVMLLSTLHSESTLPLSTADKPRYLFVEFPLYASVLKIFHWQKYIASDYLIYVFS